MFGHIDPGLSKVSRLREGTLRSKYCIFAKKTQIPERGEVTIGAFGGCLPPKFAEFL